MKVAIGSTVYDAADIPVAIILTKDELAEISSQGEGDSFIISRCPGRSDADEQIWLDGVKQAAFPRTIIDAKTDMTDLE